MKDFGNCTWGAMLLGSSLALRKKDWLVRVRAVNLDMENKSDAFPPWRCRRTPSR